MRVLAAPALFTQLASELTTTARFGSLHADVAVFLAKCFASTHRNTAQVTEYYVTEVVLFNAIQYTREMLC
jgi:hypothetical protein